MKGIKVFVGNRLLDEGMKIGRKEGRKLGREEGR